MLGIGRSRFYPSFRLVLRRVLVRPFRRRIKLQANYGRNDDYDHQRSGEDQGLRLTRFTENLTVHRYSRVLLALTCA